MTWKRAICFALVAAFACPASAPARGEGARPVECVVLDIDRIGPARLAALMATKGLETWIELDDEAFVCGLAEAIADLEESRYLKGSAGALEPGRLRLAYRQSRAQLEERGLRVLAAGGLFAVVEGPESLSAGSELLELLELLEPGDRMPDLLSLRSPLVLARQLANQAVRPQIRAGEGTAAGLVAQIDSERWFADVESLAAYNRYSGGSEIHDAREWLERQFDGLPLLTVESHFFRLEGVQLANVVATLPGRTRPDDWFIVGGHYDSTSNAPFFAAPGAEDNASGCAGVLEMARIFAAHPPEATILFICYAGEEQGLFGSADHVKELLGSGRVDRVGAMLNLDMIGFSADADLDCLLQSNAKGRDLIEALADSGARHTGLRLVTSYGIGGSDHVPYAAFGIPAVMSIENDWSVYPHYHRTTDTPDHLNPEMAAEILRMNVGALARFVGNSDIAGCLEVEGEPLIGASVSAKQSGTSSQKTASDRLGCFAVDPVVREKTFKLRIKADRRPQGDSSLSGCVRLLGRPVENRRVTLRQPGRKTLKGRSDGDGCFSFEAVADKRFTLVLKGPEVPSQGQGW